MSNIIQTSSFEQALIQGDLASLTSNQRLSYYKQVCESVGLNPLTKPFEYIQLNGKLTLYAKRDATDQLRKIHAVSINITSREKIDDIYVVTARAKGKDGREDESTGAVCFTNLKGDALANAFLKAETKAKRRVTLSICGLGLLDETEVATIPEAKIFQENEIATPQISEKVKELYVEEPHLEPNNPGDYVINFGKYRGQVLKDLDIPVIDGYRKWLISSAEKTGKVLSGDIAEFCHVAEAYISSGDNIPF